ncbi:DUF2065 domain-containing protein [Burkholderiaceae bacterium DAT-1]|nr:DUF2065 domain-containing protein [Burkholderiaceae bacterium DAT-1]
MNTDLVVTVLALVLIVEGLLPFISPATWRKVVLQMMTLEDGQIRFIGLAAVLSGLFLLWLS